MHRCATSPSSRTTSLPHCGHFAGIRQRLVPEGRFAGAPDDHRVADPHVLALDFVRVVQRRVRDVRSAQLHRAKQRYRRDDPGATHRRLDILDHGGPFLRRQLVRDRPARRARGKAELIARAQVVHLVNDPVDLEGKLVALLQDLAVVRQQIVDAIQKAKVFADRKAPILETLRRLRVPCPDRLRQRAEAPGKERERTRSADPRIELAQASRRGVARIREQTLAALELLGVEALEILLRDHDLAAYLEHVGPALARQSLRHALDRANVRGDVLAGRPVAARARQHEFSLLVAQAYRGSVEFRLRGVRDAVALQGLPAAPVPFADLLFVESVVDRRHRHAVPDLAEAAHHLRPYALRRRIGGSQLGMFLLELDQLAKQPVVLRV
jgi:hypothetical protein